MAPAITHFLVGAALALVVASPLALRDELDATTIVWLVPLGGIWGIVPDLHHIAPVFSDSLYALHGSPLVDVFALHYTLDRPTIRRLYLESIFAAIAVFLVAAATFTLSDAVGDREYVAVTPRARIGTAVGAAVAGAGYATFALGVSLSATGQLRNVGALVGSRNLVVSGLLLGPIGLVLGGVVAVVLERIGPSRVVLDPVLAGSLGSVVGGGIWLLGGTMLLPLWLRWRVGADVSVPFVHLGSLGGLVLFGAVFGVVSATVRGAFVPGGNRRTLVSALRSESDRE